MPIVQPSVNFDELEKQDAERRKPLPEGVYDFQVASVELTQTKKNDPMAVWQLAVVNNPEYNGRKMMHRTPLAGGGAGFWIAFCKATGKRPQGSEAYDLQDWVGLSCQANVTHEPGNTLDDDGNPVMFANIKNFL